MGLLLMTLQLTAQSFSYTLDPGFFNIIDENTGDTMLWFTDNNNLRVQRSFRVEKNSTVGSIRMRALDNPEIKIFDVNGAENVRITSEINGSGGAILLTTHQDLTTHFSNLQTVTLEYRH